MNIFTHTAGAHNMAEVVSEDLVIRSAEDGLNLLGELYYSNYNALLIHRKNIINDFFDLKNGMAGEILQKFSNYRMRLAIIGDLHEYRGKSLNDFISESNKNGHVIFVNATAEALDRFSPGPQQ